MHTGVKMTAETGTKEEFLSSSQSGISPFSPQMWGFSTILMDLLLLLNAALGVP